MASTLELLQLVEGRMRRIQRISGCTPSVLLIPSTKTARLIFEFMRRLHPSPVRLAVLLSVGCLAASVRAGAVGYTNSFNTQPAAADWSTASIGSAAGNITTAAGLDAAVQGIAASGVTAPL